MNRTLPPLGIQQRHSVAEVTPAAPRYLDLFTATKQRGTYLEDMLMEVPTKRVSMAALDQQFESEATLTENVVEFVAEAEGTDPLNLPPLYATVDPDHLDSVFRSGTTGRIMFEYCGYRLAVDSNGQVEQLDT